MPLQLNVILSILTAHFFNVKCMVFFSKGFVFKRYCTFTSWNIRQSDKFTGLVSKTLCIIAQEKNIIAILPF